ncbi:cyclin-D1-1-like [Cynara cardunculus var. scolymus]|uniref:Cyclin, C-terminal domain-containing protein n=1 Tax=Cynara cardunculus var. scolymus TaxID=59895 RepID=A0A103YKJ8_CYNCS|nr:cyclin-D1-1-like [Cynara cardunculus var. scolymus]KVI10841.1 Cyclin, C-terminal domain-containing protein [Cynara cardunculus var. scolymus]
MSDLPLVPDPPADDAVIDSLIASEPHHLPSPDYILRCQRRSIHLTHRQDSINWILSAHAHYGFKPATAILSVNYFDRFLSSASLPGNNIWAFQLLSVTCLSLAAKMEELHIPSLLDLQVSEPRFIFESKTIQNMELLVMANLNWRLRSITPFDFLHYFIFKIPVSCRPDNDDPHGSFRSACSDLIVSTTRVIDFLRFPSSVIAAAAVMVAAGGVDVPESFYEKVNKEMVGSCHQLMEEFLVDTCPSANQIKMKLRIAEQSRAQPPSSPDRVLDAAACVSCYTCSNDGGRIPPSGDGSFGNNVSQAEPPNKRLRSFVHEEQP